MRVFASPCAALTIVCMTLGPGVSAVPPPCTSAFLPANAQEAAIPTQGRYQANLTVSAVGSYVVGFKAAYPSATGGGLGRNLIAVSLENATGALVWWLGILSSPAGVHAVAADSVVNLHAFVGFCGFFHADTSVALDAGTYRMVALTTSETEAAFSVFLPSNATLGGTSTGPATTVSEATLACDHRLHAQVLAVWSTNLIDCTQSFTIPNRAFGILTLGQGPDAKHEVNLMGPSGSPTYAPVPMFIDIQGGPAGTWTVEVPKYLTPLSLNGQPSYDTGIYGVFADVP